jgi:ATP-dependent RNA helicase DHX57
MFNRIASGTIQREHEAKEVKYYTQGESGGRGERVFLHPGSVLFGNSTYKSKFLVYFAKTKTTKIFLRDATEVSP